MAIDVWGMLQKSQIDPEKIEEAIVRLIAEHNDDEAAHIGEGRSLDQHKLSEVIDHLVASIVADKIKDREVKFLKIGWDKQSIISSFESLDGWGQSKVGTGSDIQIRGGACRLITGNALNNVTKIYLEGLIKPAGYTKNPWFQATIDFSDATDFTDVAVGVGDWLPWSATDFFGFRWSKADAKMYAYSYDNGVETKTEVAEYDPYKANILRAEMIENGTKINYYLNDVLFLTKTGLSISMQSDIYFCYAAKNRVATSSYEANIWNVVFSQDW